VPVSAPFAGIAVFASVAFGVSGFGGATSAGNQHNSAGAQSGSLSQTAATSQNGASQSGAAGQAGGTQNGGASGNGQNNVGVSGLVDAPSRYFGQTVTTAGVVGRILGPRTFTLKGEDALQSSSQPNEILVVLTGQVPDVPGRGDNNRLRAGDPVQVTGPFQNYVSIAGDGLQSSSLVGYQGTPTIVASNIAIAGAFKSGGQGQQSGGSTQSSAGSGGQSQQSGAQRQQQSGGQNARRIALSPADRQPDAVPRVAGQRRWRRGAHRGAEDGPAEGRGRHSARQCAPQ
jgi:hypothetical protein